MRKSLEEEDIVTYGCLAHWFNVLGGDLTPTQIMKHVVKVNKHFCNHNIPSSGSRIILNKSNTDRNMESALQHGIEPISQK
jgi:hypothetical protein